MKNAIIVDQKWDSSFHVSRAAFYARRVQTGVEVEGNRFNIFGERLDDIIRPVYQNEIRLIGGEGITTVKDKSQLDTLILALYFQDLKPVKVYQASQIHTIVEVKPW